MLADPGEDVGHDLFAPDILQQVVKVAGRTV